MCSRAAEGEKGRSNKTFNVMSCINLEKKDGVKNKAWLQLLINKLKRTNQG